MPKRLIIEYHTVSRQLCYHALIEADSYIDAENWLNKMIEQGTIFPKFTHLPNGNFSEWDFPQVDQNFILALQR